AGYTAVYEEAKDEESSEIRRPLPALQQGDSVELVKVTKEQQFTQPPTRYTDYFQDIVDLKFTAHMESDLDRIETGAIPWKDVLSSFYGQFDSELQDAETK
ncbi:hypothetical protein ACREYN_00380, partial [Erwinia amylovora]